MKDSTNGGRLPALFLVLRIFLLGWHAHCMVIPLVFRLVPKFRLSRDVHGENDYVFPHCGRVFFDQFSKSDVSQMCPLFNQICPVLFVLS